MMQTTKNNDALNNSIPAGALIKTLAKQKRDLELENLDLRREIEVLREDNAALKAYCAEAQYSSEAKDITKICNVLSNLWGQCGKKLGPIQELCEKMTDLKDAIGEFINKVETHEI